MTEPRWLTAARRDLGIHEEAEGSHPRIAAALACVGLGAHDDGAMAWCGAWQTLVMQEAGITPPPGSARARAWLDWGQVLDKPVSGCIAVYSRTSSPAHGHVALYLGDADGRDVILGGNQGDAVTITRIPKARLLGYRWPPGEPLPVTTAPVIGPKATRKALRQTSRKWRLLDWIKSLLGLASGTTAVGLVSGDIDQVGALLGSAQALVGTYGAWGIVALILLGGYAALEWVQKRLADDYADGRYVPSGAKYEVTQ